MRQMYRRMNTDTSMSVFPYWRVEMYASRVACCPLVSHGEYMPTGQTDWRTDGRMPARYITRSARPTQCNNYAVSAKRRPTSYHFRQLPRHQYVPKSVTVYALRADNRPETGSAIRLLLLSCVAVCGRRTRRR